MNSNKALMGYKGDSYMESGQFFCPFVPLTQTPVVLNPDDWLPSTIAPPIKVKKYRSIDDPWESPAF